MEITDSFDQDSREWISFALTHIEYPSGDFLGKILAVFSLLPLAIGIGFTTLVVFRRDLHTATFFAGQLLNEIFNYALKHFIKEPRPCKKRKTLYVEYGMPSSHSQFMWFFTIYILLFVFIRLPKRNKKLAYESVWKYFIGLFVVFMSLVISYSRVYLNYHTWQQVLYGGGIGLLTGSFWFLLMQKLFTPCFPIIASWSICERLMIRDTTLIPDIMMFEYSSQRAEANSRLRKLKSKKS